ncbi:MAG: DUF924 domain-containing protein [Rhodocyclaceae bacterium]|nr:DUF924 domain-containing protein [Rhodocyclaceae bacterium]
MGEPATPADVLTVWFGGEPHAPRRQWFAKDPAFDREIARRFGDTVELALAGGLTDWNAGPTERLARLIVLDQFTRQIHRGSARAFAGDPLARAEAIALLDAGQDRALTPLQRVFVLLPLEHAEDLPLQQRAVAGFAALADQAPDLAGYRDYAHRHLAVIERFGRFPHRNRDLGRRSSAAERAFLAQPGSGF